MIHFNELRYDTNTNHLIIDVAVDTQNYFDNVLIDSIIIDNQNTFVPNGPSSKPLYQYKVEETNNKVYSIPDDCNCSHVKTEDELSCYIKDTEGKQVRLQLPLSILTKFNIDPNKDMLFIYVIATGVPSPGTPCGLDNSKIMGTVVNLKPIYDNMLYYVRQIENNCNMPKEFIDSILLYKALDLSIKTCNYPLAIKYWTKYISNPTINTSTNKTCNCYGQSI